MMLDICWTAASNTKSRINTGVLGGFEELLEFSGVVTWQLKTQKIPTNGRVPRKSRINTGVFVLETSVLQRPTSPTFPTHHLCAMAAVEALTATERRKAKRALRARVWQMTDGNCWYCGTATNPFRNFEVDHYIPLSKGGADDISNLVPACSRCNAKKGNRDAESIRRGQHPFYGEMHQGGSDE